MLDFLASLTTTPPVPMRRFSGLSTLFVALFVMLAGALSAAAADIPSPALERI